METKIELSSKNTNRSSYLSPIKSNNSHYQILIKESNRNLVRMVQSKKSYAEIPPIVIGTALQFNTFETAS